MAWLPKNWNDILAVWIIVGLPLLLTYVAQQNIGLPEVVIGALIAGWTLAVQYYWRKAPPPDGTEGEN